MSDFAFFTLAAIIVCSSIFVVTLRNLVHCALFLVLAFFGVAGIFILLDAEFLAAVQVLIYVGAVTVLLLFAIMLTYKISSKSISQTNRQGGIALLVSLAIFGILCALVILSGFSTVTTKSAITKNFTAILGKQLLVDYLLPFELASIVLLVVIIGAIVLAKRER